MVIAIMSVGGLSKRGNILNIRAVGPWPQPLAEYVECKSKARRPFCPLYSPPSEWRQTVALAECGFPASGRNKIAGASATEMTVR